MALPQIKNEGTQKGLILVVDDDASVGEALANVLEDESYQTIRAHDGASALEIVKTISPDVIFLDIWLPGWDGIETLARLRETTPNSEIIMMSGHANIPNVLDAMRLGASDFIEKPFNIESVLQTIERVTKRPAKAKKNEDGIKRLAECSAGFKHHTGFHSRECAGRNLGQRTLKDSAILYGQGLHSGIKSGLILEPLPKDSGIHFSQIGSSESVPVYIDYVHSTSFATTIRAEGLAVSTIEHLMSALHAYGVCNLLIKCNGEIPILDGSSRQFCSVIESVGLEEQGGEWYEFVVDREYEVRGEGVHADEFIKLTPNADGSDKLTIAYDLDYPEPIGKQTFTYVLNSAKSFYDEISLSRTFGFLRDVEQLQRAGLARGGRLDNFVLIGEDKVVNTDLRYPNELVRHKILDLIGDIYLLGRPIIGRVHARMTGHSDNINLLRLIKSTIPGL